MKKPITFISIISIIFFISALTWFCAGIYTDSSAGREINQAKFDTLVLKTKLAADEAKCGTPEFSGRFIKAIDNIDDYSSVSLQVNGKLVYSFPPSGISLPSKGLVKSYSKAVVANDGTSLLLSASMYVVTTGTIYRYSRLAFVLILCGTVLSLFLLIILREPSKRKSEEEQPFNFDYDVSDSKDDGSDFADDEQIEEQGLEYTLLEEKQESPAESFTETTSEEVTATASEEFSYDAPEDDYYENNEFDEYDLPDTENYSDDTFLDRSEEYDDETDDSTGTSLDEEQTQDEAGTEAQEEDSSQLTFDFDAPVESISPVTGLKLQSSLNDEVNNAILEALSSKSDLTLALLRVSGLDRGNSLSEKVIEALKENSAADNIFEYNSDGYAIMLKGIDLNSSVESFDKIYTDIKEILKSNNSVNDVIIGISSVTGRNVDSQRLITEADQALIHAEEDPDSPIIAFRANPEKFKEYMENQ